MMNVVKIQSFFDRVTGKIVKEIYNHSIISMVESIRNKEHIRVLFIVNDLSAWKTESLYIEMLKHDKFEPIIGVSINLDNPNDNGQIEKYLIAKGYSFVSLDSTSELDQIGKIAPDIIFYLKPYEGSYRMQHSFRKHLNCLFCYVGYGSHLIKESHIANLPFFSYVWQHYFENEDVARETSLIKKNKGSNIVVTGLPAFDKFEQDKSLYANPWRNSSPRKRIIWAPHHTIGKQHATGINYSTFLEYADFMLDLAEKYRDQIQIVFKPHPVLYGKLLNIWGKEKTEEYYNKWANGVNTQLEMGEYSGLFMHSDAMIHDCSSFTVEYLYTKNPVLYILKEDNHCDNMTAFGKKCFYMHYFAKSKDDIIQFIENVINNKDTRKEERLQFYNDYLVSPNNKTASQNIIDSILGNNGYK